MAPDFHDLADGVWEARIFFVGQETGSADSLIQAPRRDLLMEIGRNLRDDPLLRADINCSTAALIETFVATHTSAIAMFVADQVRSWDINQLARMIELNVGRDLHYIRVVGTLIGGATGVALQSFELLLKLG